MTAATIDPPAEQLVEAPEKVLYRSARTDLRLVKKRRHPIRDPHTSELVGTTDGQYIVFVGGAFELPLEGEVELADSADGGVCTLPVEEVMAWLDKHKLNGNPHEGFWKVDVAAPAPSETELQRLMEAAWDEDMLVAILEQERAGWNRPALVATAEGALARLREVKVEAAEAGRLEAEQQAAAIEAAREEERAKAKADREERKRQREAQAQAEAAQQPQGEAE